MSRRRCVVRAVSVAFDNSEARRLEGMRRSDGHVELRVYLATTAPFSCAQRLACNGLRRPTVTGHSRASDYERDPT